MTDRDYRDIVAGLALTAFGLAMAVYAVSSYSMGSVTRMGPGMMPVSLGVILAIFGAAIAVPALSRRGSALNFKPRPLVMLSIAILAFAVLIESFGLVPAVIATAVIATFSERRVSFLAACLLGAGMALLTWSIFILGLGLPIPSFDWPL